MSDKNETAKQALLARIIQASIVGIFMSVCANSVTNAVNENTKAVNAQTDAINKQTLALKNSR